MNNASISVATVDHKLNILYRNRMIKNEIDILMHEMVAKESDWYYRFVTEWYGLDLACQFEVIPG